MIRVARSPRRQRPRAAGPVEALVELPTDRVRVREVLHAPDVIRVELQGAQKREPRVLEPPEQAVGAAEHEVRSGERGIDGGRVQCEPNRLVRVLAILRVGPEEHAIGQSSLGLGQPRVERQRPFEEVDGFKVPLWIGHSLHRLRAEIERIRLGIVRGPLVDALALSGRQRGRQTPGELQRHLALHSEHIGQLAVVLVRPARLLRGRLDQFDGDAHAATHRREHCLRPGA